MQVYVHMRSIFYEIHYRSI